MFGGGSAKPAPAPAVPKAEDVKPDASELTTRRLLAARGSGFMSNIRTGGMGVPGFGVSSASLLGLTSQ
jgi:hypothetical protein